MNINEQAFKELLTKMVKDIKTGFHDSETACIANFDGLQIHVKVTVDAEEFIDSTADKIIVG